MKTKTATLEHIPAGQLSKTLEGSLQAGGKHLSDEQVRQALSLAEVSRADFAKSAILCGITLLAKKAALKHGQWGKYLERLFSKTETRFSFDGGTYREFAIYMQLARRFLWKLEHDRFGAEVESIDAPALKALQATDLIQYQALPAQQRKDLEHWLDIFIAGRSLRRLLMDLRQAEKDAMAEPDHVGLKESVGGQEDAADSPEPPAKPVQMILWEDWTAVKKPSIEAVFSSPGVTELSGDVAAQYWRGVADDLKILHDRAAALAEAAKEGAK